MAGERSEVDDGDVVDGGCCGVEAKVRSDNGSIRAFGSVDRGAEETIRFGRVASLDSVTAARTAIGGGKGRGWREKGQRIRRKYTL